MITIQEHTIEESIINKNGFILDSGCVHFSFSLGVKEYCDNVICIDPSSSIENIPDGLTFIRKALIAGDQKKVSFFEYTDIQGNSIYNPVGDCCRLKNTVEVEACNITDIMHQYQINQFELIKLDIEGAEYSILNDIDWTISKQYSVEFHDFRNMCPNQDFYEKLFHKMSKYCDIIQHQQTDHSGGAGRNYWDSLYVLKKEYWK